MDAVVCIDPMDFDAIVVSSGLPEVLLASCLATNGRSVLLLEQADSYGGGWSSVTGDALGKWASEAVHKASSESGLQERRLAADMVHCKHPDFSGMNKQHIIDMCPKVLYKAEPLVDALVAAKAANYLELKLVQGSYILRDGQLLRVPATRADIFTSRALGPADKRALMRFLTACLEAQQGGGRLQGAFDCRPLVQVLQQEGLSRFLQEVVLYGIAMADTPQHEPNPVAGSQAAAGAPADSLAATSGQTVAAATSEAAAGGTVSSTHSSSSSDGGSSQHQQLVTAAEGAAALQLYAESLERYSQSQAQSQSAFMVPCYGCGSLPEAFVRVAAVAGAVTVLRCGASGLQDNSSTPQHSSSSSRANTGDGGDDSSSSREAKHNSGIGSGGSCGSHQTAGVASTTGQDPQPSTAIHGEQPAASVTTALAAATVQAEGAVEPSADGTGQIPNREQSIPPHRRFQVTTTHGQMLTADLVVGQQQLLQQLWQQQPAVGGAGCVWGPGNGEGCNQPSSSIADDSGSAPSIAPSQPPGAAAAAGTAATTAASTAATAAAAAAGVGSSAHCLVVLDRSLVEDESLVTLVIPPGALGPQQAGVIRGVQYGPTAGVSPPGQFLLYLVTVATPSQQLSTPASSSASAAQLHDARASNGDRAQELLLPAVQALADASDLGSAREWLPSSAAGATGRRQPQALQALFYMRPQHPSLPLLSQGVTGKETVGAAGPGSPDPAPQVSPAATAATAHSPGLPPGCVPCPGADCSLIGCRSLVQDTRALLERHCPGVAWFGEAVAAEGGSGQAAVAEVLDEEEVEAIDELTAALAELSGAS